MDPSDVPVKATKNTFEIIDALRELNGAGVTELSRHLDMPTSSVHDYLQTLETEEYLVNMGGTYCLSSRFVELGEHFKSRNRVYDIARPEIDDLSNRTGEHANLMIEEHGRGVFLYSAQGDNAVRLDTHAGMRVHLQTTALGKAILANKPREEVETILDRHGLPAVTDETITDRAELFDELETIREQGYSTDDEERIKGMRCVGAAIADDEGITIAGVSVSAPKSRMRGETFQSEIPNEVIKSANVIQVNVTYA